MEILSNQKCFEVGQKMPPINNVVKGELKGQFGDIVKRQISIQKCHCPRGRIHKFHMEEEILNNPNLSYASRLVPNTINLVTAHHATTMQILWQIQSSN